ncbi:MAG: CheY-like chemotaxis protein [Candidatus Omnitrophota bacterium]|jgi:CheY-like chemotaxis protein
MSKKILIIEDNEDDMQMIDNCLKNAGFEDILHAQNAEEGISIVKTENPDIIVLDTILPGKNGFEACQEIKALPGSHAKVILTTGQVDAINAGKARASGADHYLAKTLDFEDILTTIQKMD